MGMAFGKIGVKTPKHEVITTTDDYKVRKYLILANYIGAFGKPQNKCPESIAMTAPVITKTASSEAIAMTAPVVTKGGREEVMMRFILPSKYVKAEDAPRPVDERVVIREEGEKKYMVVRFSGVARENVVSKKVEELRKCLERDGYNVVS
ncbi:hypothetical protein ACS0TY_028877 [Phlomoides rotata]